MAKEVLVLILFFINSWCFAATNFRELSEWKSIYFNTKYWYVDQFNESDDTLQVFLKSKVPSDDSLSYIWNEFKINYGSQSDLGFPGYLLNSLQFHTHTNNKIVEITLKSDLRFFVSIKLVNGMVSTYEDIPPIETRGDGNPILFNVISEHNFGALSYKVVTESIDTEQFLSIIKDSLEIRYKSKSNLFFKPKVNYILSEKSLSMEIRDIVQEIIYDKNLFEHFRIVISIEDMIIQKIVKVQVLGEFANGGFFSVTTPDQSEYLPMKSAYFEYINEYENKLLSKIVSLL